MSTVLEELQNSTNVTLASSGPANSLLTARVAQGMTEQGAQVALDQPTPPGLCGNFNPACSGVSMSGTLVRAAGIEPEAPKADAAEPRQLASNADFGMN